MTPENVRDDKHGFLPTPSYSAQQNDFQGIPVEIKGSAYAYGVTHTGKPAGVILFFRWMITAYTALRDECRGADGDQLSVTGAGAGDRGWCINRPDRAAAA